MTADLFRQNRDHEGAPDEARFRAMAPNPTRRSLMVAVLNGWFTDMLAGRMD